MKGIIALIVITALAGVTGCAARNTPAPAATAAPTPAPTAVPTGTTNVAAVTWPTTPVTVTHQPAVPPIPVLEGVRYATHDGYDRIVLDIPGALPGYTAKYVTELRQDGSGDKVTIPGKAFLLIVLNPAQAHRDDGTATVTGTHRINLPGITSYAVIGDYEGYVSFALGLSAKRGFRIGELSNRIYFDIAV
ncbi:AMIN-like domain-containing (lipo)protein [Actinoplanes regularis]|uniref:AMIN-like domain-containing (lipo)protein n=1 Tax=Actinoplanes regularis TaxID=52697 RepID=UPI0024A5663D|nr:hypothetical protein [Actinoplanes regularis]GLW33471.1 hypothetical protein Areg01_64090 [Actinoplanes regularis]